jgi:hypothetical protein
LIQCLAAYYSTKAARKRADSQFGSGFISDDTTGVGDFMSTDKDKRLLHDKSSSSEKPEVLRLEQRIFLKVSTAI